MKILYGVQGTGNGHLTRALSLIPHLRKYGTVDLAITGHGYDVEIPYEIRFKHHGISLKYGDDGKISLIRMLKSIKFSDLMRDIISLPVEDYNLIISDFDPVTSYASILKGRKCVSIASQNALLSSQVPKARFNGLMDIAAYELIIKFFAPGNPRLGVYFSSYDKNIVTPPIREEVRSAEISNRGHITVYLPYYPDDFLLDTFKKLPDERWEVFSSKATADRTAGNVVIRKINSKDFVESLASSKGAILGAGVEAPAEALFLGKKLMVVPIANHYEQKTNALNLEKLGVKTLLKVDETFPTAFKDWEERYTARRIQYPDTSEKLVRLLINMENINENMAQERRPRLLPQVVSKLFTPRRMPKLP